MGMESFFIHIIPAGVEPRENNCTYKGKSNVTKIEFISMIIKKVPRCDLHDEHNLIVDNAVLVWVGDDEMLSMFHIEGCFSWYEDCAKFIYRLLQEIKEVIPIRVHYPSYGFLDIRTEENFLENLEEITKLKRTRFHELFGNELSFKSLPGDPFYEKLKSVRRKTLLDRIGRILPWVT